MKWRFLTFLFLGYLALLLYASLMPYDLRGDESLAQVRRSHAFDCWPFHEVEHTSKADVLSNLLLYVPLGLLAAVYLQLNRRMPGFIAAFLGVLLCSAVSGTVEWIQSYSATRTCSAQDFLMNSLGGGAGALLGAAVGRRWWERLAEHARTRRRDNPLSLAGAALVLVAVIDALYPFRPTIDVSQVWHAVKASSLGIGKGLETHAWHHWLIARAGFWMVLTILLAAGGRKPGQMRWWRGALLAGLLAVGLELCKPFIEGRTANAANVFTSLCGVGAGLVLGAVFFGRLPRAALPWSVALLMGAYIVYLELLPFTFAWDWAVIQKKMPHGAEWLPMFHYATHGGIADVQMFAQNLLLAGVMTYAAGIGSPRQAVYRFDWVLKAVLLTGFMAMLLEQAQFLLPGRSPTVTDVFTLTLGGGIGAWLSAEAAKEMLTAENARRASAVPLRGSHFR